MQQLTQLRRDKSAACPVPVLKPDTKTLFQDRDMGSFRYGSPLEGRIARRVAAAIEDFDMISEGDKLLVCVSGGKDSYALLDILRIMQRRAPIDFQILAFNVDQGWPGYATNLIEDHLRREDVPYHMAVENYAKVVEEKLRPGQTPCTLCSRFRRGFLYRIAPELGCNKIVLGHHLDDLCETLVMNFFYSGRLGTMPPKLTSDDGRNVVIRPMAYVPESELIAYAAERRYPVVKCGCPSCGLPDQKRQIVKRLLTSVEEDSPGAKHQMLAAMRNVKPHLLLDAELLEKLFGAGAQARGARRTPSDPADLDGLA